MGTTSLVSRAYGANNVKRKDGGDTSLLCIPIALVITAVIWNMEWILQHVGRADDLDFAAAKQYYSISVIGLFLFVSMSYTLLPIVLSGKQRFLC